MKVSSFFSALGRLFDHVETYGKEGFRVWKSKLATTEKLQKYKLPGIKYDLYLRAGTSDYPTFIQVFSDNQYDHPFDVQPKVIIDCGANIGLAAVYFANKYPDATIISIEPESSNFEVLKLNTQHYPNIHCLKNGIWNRKANLKIEDIGLGKWGFITTEVPEPEPNTIAALSINDIREMFSIDEIDILKIDIEGSEKQMFKDNYSGWMNKSKLIIIELHDRMQKGTAKAFFDALHPYDYQLEMKGENIFCELNH